MDSTPTRRLLARGLVLIAALVSAAAVFPTASASALPQRLVELKSVSNGCTVRVVMSASGHPLRCGNSWNAHENEFLITDLGDDFSVYSIAGSIYVGANFSVTNFPLQARAASVGSWERFKFISTTYNGRQAYYLASMGATDAVEYVGVNFSVSGAPLQVRAYQVGTWELFYLQDVAG